MIHYIYNTHYLIEDEPAITAMLKTVASSKGKVINKFFFHFVSESKIQKLNKDHLTHDYVTDVITFDYSDDKAINAEAFICPSEVLKNAKRYNQPAENEVVRVVLHALLHVLGYDDNTKESRKEMRKQEDSFIAAFNKRHK